MGALAKSAPAGHDHDRRSASVEVGGVSAGSVKPCVNNSQRRISSKPLDRFEPQLAERVRRLLVAFADFLSVIVQRRCITRDFCKFASLESKKRNDNTHKRGFVQRSSGEGRTKMRPYLFILPIIVGGTGVGTG